MVWIAVFNGLFIIEDRLRFLERNTVFALVLQVLPLIPLKQNNVHIYIVCIHGPSVKTFVVSEAGLKITLWEGKNDGYFLSAHKAS